MNTYTVTITNLFTPSLVYKRDITERNQSEAEAKYLCTVTAITGQPAGNWEVKSEVCRWKPK